MTERGDETSFVPRIGRMRARGGQPVQPYLQRVRAGVGRFATGRASFGRGGGLGLQTARRTSGRFARRAVVKTRIVKLRGLGLGAARAHLTYIQRDGASRNGASGRLYGAHEEEVNADRFLGRSDEDRHQFRFIVSPEDASELDDLKPFVRGLMAQMERDLGTRLDWVAVDHFNTDHPHTHIVLRGRDERGEDLVIARDYIAHGMRARASELLTLELGPVSEHDLRRSYAAEAAQHRFTRIDRDLLRTNADGVVDLRSVARGETARFRQTVVRTRLQALESLGLAAPAGRDRWRLSDRLEQTLSAMGERGDIIKTMHRDLHAAGAGRIGADCAIFDPTQTGARLVGRVVARGLADELRDRFYVVVDGVDGRAHYAELGELADPADAAPGAVIALTGRSAAVRQSDRTVARIAAEAGGVYSEAHHRAAEPDASPDYIRAHVRRLEAMRRAGFTERRPDGTWVISESHLDKARAYERRAALRQPAQITLLSPIGPKAMVEARGATWLDRQLVADTPEPLRATGFGAEAKAALVQRRRWLVAQSHAVENARGVTYRRGLLRVLQQEELAAEGARLAKELGKSYRTPTDGERIEGAYRRPVRLASGKFAVIEASKEFSLTPWRPVLERSRGEQIIGVVRGASVSYAPGRRRGLGVS